MVLDGEDLDEGTLRGFARWTNLAGTTFVLPPTAARADSRVRILTPNREMPFADRPTLDICAARLHTGGRTCEAGVMRQECGVGIVEIEPRSVGIHYRRPRADAV